MQNKLRQLIIIALKRNHMTRNLPIAVTIRGYKVTVSGSVASRGQHYEVINTIEAVSPHLRVESFISVDREAPAKAAVR